MAAERVVCKTISDFRDASYDDDEDRYRYAVIVPRELLSRLDDTEEYGYVRLRQADERGADGDDGDGGDGNDGGTLAQVVSFSDDHDVAQYSDADGTPWACIRTSLQRAIGIETEPGEDNVVEISECDLRKLDDLTVHRNSAWESQSQDITTEGAACYIHSADMAAMAALDPGDVCELMNPETGARIRLPVETYQHRNRDRGTVRLDGTTRKLLGVESHDEGESNSVQLRILQSGDWTTTSTVRTVAEWIGRRFVDYSYIHLRVLPGYDRDEGRNIVRLNRDVMERLGIDESDRVLIDWEDERRNVRCQSGWDADEALHPVDSTESSIGEMESLAVRMPSTERDKLNISVGDSVRVHRDMGYQAGKQVSLSVFGILGVIVGAGQLINMVFEQVDLTYVAVTLLAVVVLSIPTIWFILRPVRQKCQVPE